MPYCVDGSGNILVAAGGAAWSTSTSGYTQAQQYTITASGIGVNTTTSWLVRDVGAAAAGTLDSQWAGMLPNANGGIYQGQNQNPATFSPTGAAPGVPHPYVGNILAGAHYTNGQPLNSTTGNNVMPWVNATPPTLPYVYYMSAWVRFDANWVYASLPYLFNFAGTSTNGSPIITGISSADIAKMDNSTNTAQVSAGGPGIGSSNINITTIGANSVTMASNAGAGAGSGTFGYFNSHFDNNTKNHDYGYGNSPYPGNYDYAACYGPYNSPASTSNVQWVWDDASNTMPNPDDGGHNTFWNLVSALPASGWQKWEYEVFCVTVSGLANGGQWSTYENNVRKMHYQGLTDFTNPPAPSAIRHYCFGGYSRQIDIHNFRYFADLRVGIGAGSASVGSRFPRLMAGNASTMVTCTIAEPQDIVTWSDPTLTFNFWKGALTTGSTVYFHVITAAGTTMDNVAHGTVN